jgi:putative ABC transport system permease protein
MPAKKQRERAAKALKMVGLGDRLNHRPSELSGGQQQRVAIARAVVGNPPIILADEPTGNLDSVSGREIMGLLQNLHRSGSTVIVITHDSNIAQRAGRILSIKDGVITEREGGARHEPKPCPDNAETYINNYLFKKFRSEDGYRIFNQSEMLSTISEITGTLTAMLAGIAGISLLVGGIGIMNIMLVLVTERTREIGIRKALGAKHSNILVQFLIEAVVISGLGGIIGIIFGIAGSMAISNMAGFNTVISLNVILLASMFSILVGVAFGIYPANKAALLNPIDALRYE